MNNATELEIVRSAVSLPGAAITRTALIIDPNASDEQLAQIGEQRRIAEPVGAEREDAQLGPARLAREFVSPGLAVDLVLAHLGQVVEADEQMRPFAFDVQRRELLLRMVEAPAVGRAPQVDQPLRRHLGGVLALVHLGLHHTLA